jgi:hypothetical protein
MALTASKMAACIMAKLRVEWMAAGCAPGVLRITRRLLFHSTAGLTKAVEPSDGAASPAPWVELAKEIWAAEKAINRMAHGSILFTTELTSLVEIA